MLDGEPLRLGFVRVLPENGRGASGQIATDGRFVFSTYQPGDGCLRRRHGIEVTAVEFAGDETSAPGASANQRWLIPKKLFQDLECIANISPSFRKEANK